VTTTATRPKPPRWGPLGLVPALVLVSVNFLDGMEANFIPGVLSLLQDEWGFGDTAAGAIPTAMAIAGLLVTLPAGYLADRVVRTRLLAVVVASWSVFTLASALATAFWMFFVIRVLLGTAAHVDNPCSSSLITDYYPAASRARVFALQRAAWYVGISLGIALGGVLGEAFGWRAPFLVMVLPGLVVALLVWRLPEPVRGGLEPPADGARATAAGADVAPVPASGRGWRALWADARSLLDVPTLRLVFVGVAVAFAGFNGLGYWLPSFWERQFDLSEGESAALTGAVALVATLSGSWIGGVLGDRWHASRRAGRIDLAAGALLIGGVVLVVSLAMPVLVVQIPLLVVAAILLVSGMPSYAAAVADVLPVSRRGIGFALFTFLVTLASALGPLLVGVVSDLTGSLRTALIAGALPCIPGAFVLARARTTYPADAAAISG
jgi:MFS family permease